MSGKERLVLHFQLHGEPGRTENPDYMDVFSDRGYRVLSFSAGGRRNSHLILYYIAKIQLIARCNIVVTTDYISAFIVASLVRILRLRVRQICIGMNISGRPLRFQSSALTDWVNKTIQRIELIVVASRAEIRAFTDLHGIEPKRIVFAHWAFDLPRSESKVFSNRSRPYFCMIGRNNRDFELFSAAIEGLPADGIVIATGSPDFIVAKNVFWFKNLSMSDCIDCVRNSVANVILVRDAERGAGHITIVMAMHCAKATIVSDVDTVGDYLVNGFSAYFVPLGSSQDVAKTLQHVLESPTEAQAMGSEAARYAAKWLSHRKRAERIREILAAWELGEHINVADPEWTVEHTLLQSAVRDHIDSVTIGQ